ncbi:RNA-directed DNA polymerase, eukaryota, reverse transcriptase zinc-binding domain protein [Tanacetum coccineum]
MWDPSTFTRIRIWCSDNYVIVQGKWMNSVDDYFLINVYGPQNQPEKSYLWEFLRSFIQSHVGNVILFGDLNEVRCEAERSGSFFSSSDTEIFNTFIHNVGFIDLLLGGRKFTWMNKTGAKMSKLDRFLISNNVLHAHPNMQVTVLEKVWSDHNPILLHCSKTDFGPIPFKLFHSWFNRFDFDDTVKNLGLLFRWLMMVPIWLYMKKLNASKLSLNFGTPALKPLKPAGRKPVNIIHPYDTISGGLVK